MSTTFEQLRAAHDAAYPGDVGYCRHPCECLDCDEYWPASKALTETRRNVSLEAVDAVRELEQETEVLRGVIVDMARKASYSDARLDRFITAAQAVLERVEAGAGYVDLIRVLSKLRDVMLTMPGSDA